MLTWSLLIPPSARRAGGSLAISASITRKPIAAAKGAATRPIRRSLSSAYFDAASSSSTERGALDAGGAAPGFGGLRKAARNRSPSAPRSLARALTGHLGYR